MTCVELERSLAEVDDGSEPEQRDHLKHCPRCAALVAELLAIACAGGELREAQEPSPRVWNSIEIELRREGLIGPQRPRHSLLPSFGHRWTWGHWLAPAAAILLLTVGIYLRRDSQNSLRPAADSTSVPVKASLSDDVRVGGLNDDDLMAEIAQQPPALKAQYTDNLQRVNDYIRDAKTSVDADPTDDEARRSLMEAYQQKAMLFELALDRSLQ